MEDPSPTGKYPRVQLEEIFEPAGMAQEELARTVSNRVIIVHGPTGTGKSTVIPWEAMVWLEAYCSCRGRQPGRVICSQQRRKVTISLADEVLKSLGLGSFSVPDLKKPIPAPSEEAAHLLLPLLNLLKNPPSLLKNLPSLLKRIDPPP